MPTHTAAHQRYRAGAVALLAGPALVLSLVLGTGTSASSAQCETTTTAAGTTSTTTGGTTTTAGETTTTTAETTTTAAETTTTAAETTTTAAETTTTTSGSGAAAAAEATTTTLAGETTTTASGATTTTVCTTTTTGGPTTTAGGTTHTQASIVGGDTTVSPGQKVTFQGGGFAANAPLQLEFQSTPVPLGSTNADASGNFKATVTIPTDASAGPHKLVARGAGAQGGVNESSVDIVVAAAGTIAVTGMRMGALAMAGLGALGAVLLIWAGERKVARAAT